MNKNKGKDVVASLGKALAVLECFSLDKSKLTISQAAALTGLDRAAARRYLISLTHFGYLATDNKLYWPTLKVLRLGVGTLSAMPLPQLIQPWLDQLSEELQQSCSVSLLDGAEIVYIARASQKRVMSIGLMPGSRLPAHCTSMGRVLLANSAPQLVDKILNTSDLTPLTPYTLSNLEQLKAELSKVKQAGYALVDQEVELGLRSLAVPLYNLQGKVVAALNTGIPSILAEPKEMLDKFLPAMLNLQQGVRRYIHTN